MRTNTQEAVLSAYIVSIGKCAPRDAAHIYRRKQERRGGPGFFREAKLRRSQRYQVRLRGHRPSNAAQCSLARWSQHVGGYGNRDHSAQEQIPTGRGTRRRARSFLRDGNFFSEVR
jgi:hypothetical protein